MMCRRLPHRVVIGRLLRIHAHSGYKVRPLLALAVHRWRHLTVEIHNAKQLILSLVLAHGSVQLMTSGGVRLP